MRPLVNSRKADGSGCQWSLSLTPGQGVVHPQLFEAWLMSVAGLRVVAHLRRRTIYGMMRAAAPRADGPVGFVDHKRLLPSGRMLADAMSETPIGCAIISRPGHL